MNNLQIVGRYPEVFKDRYDAGRKLARELRRYKDKNTVVLSLPRGGVPVGFEIAQDLKVPMDVIISRKIGAPSNPEFGIGAIAEKETLILDEPTVELLGIRKTAISAIVEKEREELERRVKKYRLGTSLPSLKGKDVILVDDGLATGVTALAAIKAIAKLNPNYVLFAIPVCAYDTTVMLRSSVDNLFCFSSPHDFKAVGLYYQNFDQTTDEEVVKLLKKSKTLHQKPH